MGQWYEQPSSDSVVDEESVSDVIKALQSRMDDSIEHEEHDDVDVSAYGANDDRIDLL